MVELFRERLQVHVRRVHILVKLGPRIRRDIAGCYGYAADVEFVARLRDVDRIFRKNDRVVVGEGNGAAAQSARRACDSLRRRCVRQLIPTPSLADIPVLAEAATEIAARSAERQDTATRQKMIERLFLDGVRAEAAASSVSRQLHRIAGSPADKTESALAIVELAKAWAQTALDPSVRQHGPPARGVMGLGYRIEHGSSKTSEYNTATPYPTPNGPS